MKKDSVDAAAYEARRFLERVAAITWEQQGSYWYTGDYVATASLRRTSMELTRALAKMRR